MSQTEATGPNGRSGRDLLFGVRFAGQTVRTLRRAGVLKPVSPLRLPAMGRALRLGPGPASLVAVGAAHHPDRVAVADDLGEISFAELDRRGAGIAASLKRDFEVDESRGLAVMCRNHRGLVEALAAGSRLGADLLLLGTDLPASQLAAVLERERPAVVVHDDEFAGLFEQTEFSTRGRVTAWSDRDEPGPTLEELAAGPDMKPFRPASPSRTIVLTSGTTGVPKSAPRQTKPSAMLGPLVTLLSNLPLRSGDPILVSQPAFHGYGLGFLSLALALRSPLVLRRRFEAEGALAAIERHRVRLLTAVPVMLDRILSCPPELLGSYDTSSLQAVVSGGSALSAGTSTGVMDAFGDVLYNLYGSTETGFAAIAGPADLRAAPGTVGRPPFGTKLRVLDAERRDATVDEVGHVFIGGKLVFEGYGSKDEAKETVGGLMNTGDLGHLDSDGRLLIDGREDDMVVSGGENVFPQEVADVLGGHRAVADVAVLGVDDEEFGQRLRAYVVPIPGPAPSSEELRAYVKEHLPRFQVPREFMFVAEIPRTATGKVRRRELRASGAGSGQPSSSS